jgi:hypothetical protein
MKLTLPLVAVIALLTVSAGRVQAQTCTTTAATGGVLNINANGSYNLQGNTMMIGTVTLYAKKGAQTNSIPTTHGANDTWIGALQCTSGTWEVWASYVF